MDGCNILLQREFSKGLYAALRIICKVPFGYDLSGIFKTLEPMLVQEFVTKTSVETLN